MGRVSCRVVEVNETPYSGDTGGYGHFEVDLQRLRL